MLQATNIEKNIRQSQKGYRAQILNDVSLSVSPGEMLSIMGPSGCGKSTLLGILGGLDAPSSGKVKIDDVDLYSLTQSKLDKVRSRRIGMVFQNPNLIDDLTCYDNIALPLVFADEMKNPDKTKRIDELVDYLGLKDRKKQFPYQLSGGEQQRTAIARALATQPGILLADEPTGNLDQKNAHMIIDILLNIANTYKTAIIIVTHDNSVSAKCHRTINMIDGRFVQ